MNRLTDWYLGLSRASKIALISGGIIIAAIIAIAVLYMVFTPAKVEVKYGTIVRDPIDNYVWEDNTQTIWVAPEEAGNYRIEYITKYSDEHQQQIDEEQQRLAEQQQQLANSQGYESVQTVMPQGTLEDLNKLQESISVLSQDVMTGLEMINEIAETQAALQAHYNEIAAYSVIPQAEQYKQTYLSAISLWIQSCDMALKGIETTDQSYFSQAQNLFNQAIAIVQELGATLSSLVPPQ
jgi:plastocyanin